MLYELKINNYTTEFYVTVNDTEKTVLVYNTLYQLDDSYDPANDFTMEIKSRDIAANGTNFETSHYTLFTDNGYYVATSSRSHSVRESHNPYEALARLVAILE